jgi:hypothetical protein
MNIDSEYRNTLAFGRRVSDFFALLPEPRIAGIDPLISKGGVRRKNAA